MSYHRPLFETLESRELLAASTVDLWVKPVVFGDAFFYAATDSEHGTELWKSDGTEQGTALLKDLRTGTNGSEISQLTPCGNTLFFTANDGSKGVELWKTNGTASGTALVKDICLGANGSDPDKLTAVGNTLFFIADEGVNGTELWKSDGTASGTVLVKDIWSGVNSGCGWSSELCAVGNTLFFSAQTAEGNYELWKSDGTTNGTVLVKEIRGGAVGSYPAQMIAVGSTLYFTADDGSAGTELWKSDGTASGTVLVKDIRPGTSGSMPTNFVVSGNTLYFSANDGTLGFELWKSDGTTSVTVLVKDIQSGAKGSNPTRLTVLGNTIYFVADDGTNGVELWKSNGLANGTTLVKDIRSGPAGSNPAELTVVGNAVFFAANDGVNGVEIWKTSGTSNETTLVKNIRSGSVGSNPFHLTAMKNTLYFAATDDNAAAQLFKSGGTEDSTNRVAVHKIRPTAKIDNATTLKVQEGCSLLLTANGSQGTAEKGLTYLWDFTGNGDFREYTSESAWFSAENLDGKPNATHTIRLKVRDADGNESEIVEASVKIVDAAPTVTIGSSDFVEKQLGYWKLEASDVPYDSICKWVIDWGDGQKTELIGGPRNRVSLLHFYFEAKEYTAKVTVTDDDGIEFSFDCAINVAAIPQAVFESFQTVESVTSTYSAAPDLETPVVVADILTQETPPTMPIYFVDNQRFVAENVLREETEYLELMGKNSFNPGNDKTTELVFADDFDLFEDEYEWLGVTKNKQRSGLSSFDDHVLIELLEDAFLERTVTDGPMQEVAITSRPCCKHAARSCGR